MPTARPHRSSPALRAVRRLVLLAACALPLGGQAHQAEVHDTNSATNAATAMATELTGRVDAIVVNNRLTGTSQRFPVLHLGNGDRVRLENAGSAQSGTTLTVSGRLVKQTLYAEALRSPTPGSAGALTQKSSTRGELTGTLRMFHVDFPDGHSDYGYSLVPDAGRSNIVDLGTVLPIVNGSRATIAGPVDANGYIEPDTIDIIGEPVTGGPPVSAFTGAPLATTTGYTVVPLQFPTNTTAPFTYGSAPVTIAAIKSSVFTAANSVAEYYKEVSYGAQLLSGAILGESTGAWRQATVAKPAACSSNAELNAVLNTIDSESSTAATALGYNLGSLPGILYIANSLPCGWSGLGYIGWARAYTNGTASLLVVGHEMGHNFGLYHAGSVKCTGATIAPSGCAVAEYGDPFVIMGNQSGGHFNAYQKDVLNYIAPSTVVDHSAGSVTYTLGPIESPNQTQYAIRIPTTNPNRTYWVEFRRPIGFDSAVPAALGAQVRISVPFENNGSYVGMYDDTQFLDMTPGDSNFANGALAVGSTFSDPAYNVNIQVLAGTAGPPATLSVKVSTGGLTASTTSLTSSLNPSAQGQSVTFTATVTGTAPTGTVAFKDAGTTLASCGAVALAGAGDSRTATCSSTALAAGTHSITADYVGDAGNQASSSAALSQSVKSSSTTALASSQNPSIAGASVTLTASVSGSAPTGTVAFNADGVAIAGCTAVTLTGAGSTRSAGCTTTALAAGSRAIIASYAGDSANATSTSPTFTQVVNGSAAASTTTLSSSLNPSTQGQSVTFTATVTGTAPTGTVSFKDVGVALAGCGAVALTGAGNARTATCASASLAAGGHSITADYGGDAGNATSSSAALSQSVKATTTTDVTSSQNPAIAGASVTLTASVTGSAPAGTVAFNADSVAIPGCTAVALAGVGNTRSAACTTTTLSVGSRAIVASYGGDSANAPSTSPTLTQVITGSVTASTTTLASSQNPVNTNSNVTFTASVAGNLPTGNVSFTTDGASIAGCSGVALGGAGNTRTATCTTSTLASGTHAIVAAYAGNAQNSTSASAALSQTVNSGAGGGTPAAATTTTVTGTANPSPAGANVALIATVDANPPVNSGYVTFTANGAPIIGCAGVPVVAVGVQRAATCNTSALAPGAYSVVASYSGDAGSLASTSRVFSQVIPFAAIGNTVQIAAANYALNENGGSVFVTISRIGDVSSPAGVSYATSGGSAAADVDFASRAGTVSWAAGDASNRYVTIPILDDALGESAEAFTVSLANPAGATLGANASATVTIIDDENATLSMPGTATIVQNPYGTVTVQGATLSGNTISGLSRSTTIRLGTTPGTAGSFAKIDFQGFAIGAGNVLTLQSGAPGQTVYLTNVDATPAAITGLLRAVSGNGAAPPVIVVESEAGLTVNSAGAIASPSGLVIDTLGTPATTGGDVVNQGAIDGGPTLRIWAAKANGGGRFIGNAIAFATFGNLNNPVNGTHYLGNGLQLFPNTGNALTLAIADFGPAPQFMNLSVNGDVTFSMPSLWPNGSTLPANNRPVLPGEIRPAGTPDPTYGGGSIIVQATGNFALDGGASQDLVFPGGLALKAGGTFDVRGAAFDNGWTTSGQPFQGVFIEAAQIIDSTASSAIAMRTNNKNWANFSVRPALPVSTWTLQPQLNGTAQFAAADNAAPHLNIYSIETEAGAAGQCWTCLVNGQTIDFSAP